MKFHSALNRIKAIPDRTLVLFGLLGIATTVLFFLKEEEQKEPWDLSRLNQIKGRKVPPVLHLSGKFTDTWVSRPGSPAPRNGEFEIYIRGTNDYFMKCWHGNPTNRPSGLVNMLSSFIPLIGSHYSGWWSVEIVVDDFRGTKGQRWGRFGSQGGGGSGGDGAEWLAPGRRLWNQSGFIGALEEGQINKEIFATETFKKLKSVGDFKLPRRIEFDQRDHSQIYRIDKYEFLDSPASNWFSARKQEYFASFLAATNSLTNN